ncbi:hypothetical protein [Paramaledivibacter caminithermalis]|jgi:hypothetical protein|uniref:Uncharacterized protein n=1 Tax=Paramaledivibacter caminithermalis (strain DSM 15212 / CIP 107654 / DViRD3) TaxID=1121301 RepID=A0A1M6RLA4_PARC5|nr:hypothetical protein [Paramaledivibacter caminithermalis]SHK33243.1 hypothetical protein SAMN02745912_03008 [Paramaledivibacter caminithermalis DSM 15212]
MNKKTIAILVAVILVVVAALAYPAVKNYMITKDPINHIMYSSVKTGEKTNVNATISVTTELDEKLAIEQGVFDYMSQDPEAMAKFVNSLLKKFEILYDVNMITEEGNDLFKMDAGLGINYSGKVLVDGKLYLKPWELGIKVPKLYKKSLYVDINEAMKAEGYDFNLNDIDIRAYLDLIKKEDDLYKAVVKNYQPYKQVIYDYLQGKVEKLDDNKVSLNVYGEEKEIKATKYKLNIDILDIYDVYADLLEIAKGDEAVKALVQARVKEFKELVVKNKDYEKFGLTEEEFNEGMKEIEDEIANNWDKGLEEVISEFKSISTKPELADLENFGSSYIIAIDKEHIIRQIEFDIKSQFINVKEVISYNAFDKDVKVDVAKEESDKVNLMNLENDDALAQELGQEVISNLASELLGGEAIETLISDIKAEAKVLPAEESEEIINNVDGMLNQMKMTLPFMLNGLGF